jgi:hypothetical protein
VILGLAVAVFTACSPSCRLQCNQQLSERFGRHVLRHRQVSPCLYALPDPLPKERGFVAVEENGVVAAGYEHDADAGTVVLTRCDPDAGPRGTVEITYERF